MFKDLQISFTCRERCGCVLKNQIVSPTSTLSQKTIDVARIPHCPDNNLNLGIIKPEPLMAVVSMREIHILFWDSAGLGSLFNYDIIITELYYLYFPQVQS